jgi:hypothetical protein
VKRIADEKIAAIKDQQTVATALYQRTDDALECVRWAVDPSRPTEHLLEESTSLVPGLKMLANADLAAGPLVTPNVAFAGDAAAVVAAIDRFGSVVAMDAVASKCVLAGEGLEKARRGKPAMFTIELCDGEGKPLQDLPAEAARAMVDVSATLRPDTGGGGGGGGGAATSSDGVVEEDGENSTCTVAVTAVRGAVLSCVYTPPESEDAAATAASGPAGVAAKMVVALNVRVLGAHVPGSPFAAPLPGANGVQIGGSKASRLRSRSPKMGNVFRGA